MNVDHDAGVAGADAVVKATTRAKERGLRLHQADVGPSAATAGVGQEIAVREAEEELEAEVERFSLEVYAPSSHALVIKSCQACLGVATFITRRNRRVEEALATVDRTERLEEEVAALSATNANLLGRLLSAEARLERAAERLKQAQGSGKCGRDWLVKELARVVKDSSAMQAEGIWREQAVLERYRSMDREKRKLEDEAEAAAGRFRSQVSEAKEELEILKEALLKGNAETRREATKAVALEKEAFSLGETVKRAEERLRDSGRLLTAANRRAAEAGKEGVLLRGRLGAAKEEAIEKELEAGNRLEEAELALEAEAAQTRRLTAKLDEANAEIISLQERVADVSAAAEIDRERADVQVAAAKAEAEAASAKLAATTAAALVLRPSPPPSPSPSPSPHLPVPVSATAAIARVGVETSSTSTPTPAGAAAAVAAVPDDASNNNGDSGDRSGGGSAWKARLAARACALGVKGGLRLAAERRQKAAAEAAAAAAAVAAEGRQQRGQETKEETEEEGSVGQEEDVDEHDSVHERAGPGASTREGSWAGPTQAREGEGEEVAVWRERARVAEARLEAAEGAAKERKEEMSQALAREASRGRQKPEAFVAAVLADLGGLGSAVDLLVSSVVGGGKEDGADAGLPSVPDDDDENGRHSGDVALKTADRKLTVTGVGGHGAGVRNGGGGGGGENDGGSVSFAGGGDAAQVREVVKLLASRLAGATGGVAELRARVADAIKRTTLGRETREAERVRTAKLVKALRAEVEELKLRARPRTGQTGVQTTMQGADLRATEALVLELQRKHEDFEVEVETLREESDRRQELARLKAEEDTLKAEDDLHASRVREGSARAYCRRLEGRVAALMAHRETLRQEKRVLRAAVQASFRDAMAKEHQRMQMRRTVATQVKCSVCALHGELGAGQDTAVHQAAAITTPAAGVPAAAATPCRTNVNESAPTETGLYRHAAAAAAVGTSAAPRLRPGKAWRRPKSEFPNRGVSGAAGGGSGDGSGHVPGVIEGCAGDGDGDGDGDDALPVSNRNRRREDGCAKIRVPRGRGCRRDMNRDRDGLAGLDDLDEGVDHDGDVGRGGVSERARGREGWVGRDRGGGGGGDGRGGGGGGGREEAEEPLPLPQHSNSSSSSSSSTSGILVRRGLKTGEISILTDRARHRGTTGGKKKRARRSTSSASALPVPLPSPAPRVDVPRLLAEDGVVRDRDPPLGVVAARVQQQRFGNVGVGVRRTVLQRTSR